ncbi:hypothetical protein [Haloarcula rara]|uniref:hypothetical protein n=1 Tax=Haloarcula rara TaxID=3033387 RepID=UPI0023E7C346|nr:hypothetical protein [Halomicroarcula sp. SHR3]
MARTRRDALRLAGVSVATLAAGCLDDTADEPAGTTGDRTETTTDPGTPTDGTEKPPEPGTPTDGELPSDLARVDEPPYEISVPQCDETDSDEGGRDPLYLCADMASEPSLSFEQASARGSVFPDAGLENTKDNANEQVFATLLTEDSDRTRVDGDADDGPVELIEGTEFDTHAVLVVETGWGSGSVVPHIKRVEATDDGVRAFGCHSDPCIQTDDYTSRTVAVRFERPETLSAAVASLTVASDERWNVAAGEGVVSIPDS